MKGLNAAKLISKIFFVIFAVLYAVMQTAYVITAENQGIISQTLGQSNYEKIESGNGAEDTDYFKTDYSDLASLTADGAAQAFEEAKVWPSLATDFLLEVFG